MAVRVDDDGEQVVAPLTVRDVLGFEVLAGAVVLAGEAGLDREISGANIVEVPEVSSWLRGGELLFTTGYPWRDDPRRLSELLADLGRVGAAGLLVKLGRYVNEVPVEALSVADRLGLPLVRIPPDVPYMDVIEPLYRRLSSQRLWVLERSLRAQELFASLALTEQSVERLVAMLASQTGGRAYVIDTVEGSVSVASAGGAARTAPIEALAPEDRTVVAPFLEPTTTRGQVRVVASAPLTLAAPLVVGRFVQGTVLLVQDGPALDGFAELALTHAAEALSFLLMRRTAIAEGRREAGGLFLASLMSESLSNEEGAERALSLGLRLTRPCVAFVVATAGARSPEDPALLRLVDAGLVGIPHAIGTIGEGELLVLAQSSEGTAAGSSDDVDERIRRLSARAELGALVVGCGSSRPGLDGVRRSRSEAIIAYQVARRTKTEGLLRFEDLGVERMLAQIPPTEEVRDYVASTIGPLEDDPDLLLTLQVFLEQGGNKVATAARIPLHRSSLMYRLDKISNRLGVDVNDPERRLELWLALRLRRMLGVGRSPDGA